MASLEWKRHVKLVVKSALGVIVLGAVGRHVFRTWKELQKHGESVHVEPFWIVVAAILYVAGLTAFGIFFGRIMKSSPSPVRAYPALRAYLISHLGKYVPGKAMVVVMRVGMVVPYGARPVTAAIATFYETLVMMGAGALIAAAGFGIGSSPVQVVPVALASALAIGFLVVVDPAVFPRISRFVTMPFPKVGPEAEPVLSRRLLSVGLGWTLLGWALLGMSQVAVVRAVTTAGVDPGLWPLITASVALATVAGFVVAVLPGGLGVREGVLMTTLAPALGQEKAVVAALALRLTWVAAEVMAAAVLAGFRPSASESKALADHSPEASIAVGDIPGGEDPER